MHCPFCGSADSKVTDSRVVENGIRRRRECRDCQARYTTYERVQATALTVTKRDGRREEFDRAKMEAGIRQACTKRPVSARAVEKMVEEIEAEASHLGQAEVSTNALGRMVMDRLRLLDRVAYIRFASIYRDFQDIESFEEVVKDLRENSTQLPLLEDMPQRPPARRRRGRPPGIRYRTENGSSPADNSHSGGSPAEMAHKESRPDERRPQPNGPDPALGTQ